MTTTSSNINIYGGSRILTKHEEIREGIAKRLLYHTNDNEMLSEMIADNLLFYLHSQGVVIKVDRELPKSRYYSDDPEGLIRRVGYQEMLKDGYSAWEPLI